MKRPPDSHLVEPLHGANISDFFLETDGHLGEIVLDGATELLHAPAVVVGDHRDRRQQ